MLVCVSSSINYYHLVKKFTFSPLNDLCDLTNGLYARHCISYIPKPYIIPMQLLEFLPFMP